MKSAVASAALLACGLAAGLWLAGGGLEARAPAQVVPGNAPRYQISAWAMGHPMLPPGAGRGERGCYIVDTATGQLWHAAADGPVKKVADKMP
jgi:hypothetical protein